MRKLIVAFLLLLSGCTTTQYVPAPEMAPIMDKTQSIYHPQLPAPVGSFPCAENFNCWKIIDLNGVPYKAISHNDSIDFSVWIKERNAYDKKIKEILCFFQPSNISLQLIQSGMNLFSCNFTFFIFFIKHGFNSVGFIPEDSYCPVNIICYRI